METGMPVYPGSEPALMHKISDIESAGYNETLLHISAHTGTHIDCGQHLAAGSFDTGTASTDRFYGKGLVVDCQHMSASDFISEKFLRAFENKIKQAEFVIFHTGWSRFWGDPEYFSRFPVLDEEASRYLCRFSLKGAGIDAISFDPVGARDLTVHKVLLSQGIILIENLTNLESLPEEGFMFCCFPLKIKHGDGSPVRAVGIVGDK